MYLSPDELAETWRTLPKRLLWARYACTRPVLSVLSSAGFAWEQLNAWEAGRGEPTWDQIRTLARIYDVLDDFLLFGETRDVPEVLHSFLDGTTKDEAQASYIAISVTRLDPTYGILAVFRTRR